VVAKIEKALRGPLASSGLDFAETPLEEVVNLLQQEYGIPVQLDRKALDDIGFDSAEPVTINLHGISLRSALRLMLHQLQLTYVIQNEVLIITTPEQAESQLLVCVYDIRQLTGDATVDFDSVIDVIVECVATETWDENGGGEAAIRPLQPGLLVISQTQAVHHEIRDLLETIREIPKLQQPAAADGAAVEQAADEVVTRSYLLQIGHSDDSQKLRSQVYDLLVKAIPDERWTGRLEDGQSIVLTVLADRIVLRHRPSVHEQVRAFLADSGIAAPLTEMAGRKAGGGGGGFFQLDPRPAN
jgi:hypothetical protein